VLRPQSNDLNALKTSVFGGMDSFKVCIKVQMQQWLIL